MEGRPQTLNWTSANPIGPVVAIIQARMGSSRLPGKSLAEIEGRPMLWHVIQRVKRASLVDRVVVATSTARADNAIEEMCRENGVACYRGSENDVLDRFYMAARAEKASQVVRITADCPLIDPEVIDRVVRRFNAAISITPPMPWCGVIPMVWTRRSFLFRPGTGVARGGEEFGARACDALPAHRGSFAPPTSSAIPLSLYQHYRWTVDEAEDLEFIRAVYRAMRGKEKFGMKDVLELLEKNPGLEKMNSEIVSNRGYYKSLFEEAHAAAAPRRAIEKSKAWLERAEQVIPGCSQTFSKGSNQHVRGVAPIFLAKGKGCSVWDVDGNEYIDYIQGLLPNILGYAHEGVNAAVAEQFAQGHSFSLPHPLEVELAERLTRMIPCAEKVRFGKNGSDATSGAVRAARALTGTRSHRLLRLSRLAGLVYRQHDSKCRRAAEPCARLTHPFVYNDLGIAAETVRRASERVRRGHHGAGEFLAASSGISGRSQRPGSPAWCAAHLRRDLHVAFTLGWAARKKDLA